MDNFYCSAVDTGLFVYVTGDVKLCCSGDFALGNIREQPIQEMFASTKFIEIQEKLKNNKPHNYCSGCYHVEQQAPGSSQMSAFNDQFRGRPDKRQIKLIDVRWSDVCNLKCRYCNINDSSEWKKIRNLPIETVNKDYIDSLFEHIEQNKDSIECVYLLGGEPLMQKHNIRLLSILNSNVKIDVLTNGSVNNLENNPVYKQLQNFEHVYWNLSFDNVGDRFEYVRAGGDWQVLQNNIKTMIKDFGANAVTFHPVYTVWNALCLKEFYDFSKSLGNLRVNWQLGLAKIDEEEYASDGFLTFGHNPKIIQRAIKEIENLGIDDYFLNGIKQSLQADTPVADKGAKFLDWLERMETLIPPKHTFKELWPELNTLLTDNE